MKEVNKIYDKEVLSVKDLTVRKGCIYGVIGPSGAGKSTLLRIINLLTPVDNGEIYFEGKQVPANANEKLALQRRMAMVFQKTLLFKGSVWSNIAYGLKARKYPKAEIAIRVNNLLNQLGMEELANRHADTLSGGEAQRVAIARAIAFEPELLLLDEPTANLDPGNIELIEDMIINLARNRDITVVMVTHNIFQARRIADQVIFIDQGQVVEMNPAKKIFNDPDHEKTRLFVEGKMVY